MRRTSARKPVCTSLAMLAMGLSVLGLIACGQGSPEFRKFTSSNEGHGYSLEYPVDWSVKTGQPIKGSDGGTYDEFISADQKASVSVQCAAPQPNLDDFLQNKLGILNVGGFNDVKMNSNGLTVAEMPAPVLDYTFTVEGSTTYFTSVLVFKGCPWDMMYASTSEGRPYRDLFERMARSFTPG